ncbi:MAG: peptidylprolyl isomerase [Planctomycetota bacterium]
MVKLETTMGDIVIELDEQAAPVTVKNFLQYTAEGFYDGTVFHRVMPGFMIQAGGFTKNMKDKQTHAPIVNEFKLSNLRGTVAMAKVGGNPNSATSQFFINLTDNSRNLDRQNGGFTVFARVIEGMDVVDEIARVRRTRKMGTIKAQTVPLADVPVEPVIIKSAKPVSGKTE